MDALDEALLQLGEFSDEETETKTRKSKLESFQEIDILAEIPGPSKESPKKSLIERKDEEDDELLVNRKELSEHGRAIEKWLNNKKTTSSFISSQEFQSSRNNVLMGLSKPTISKGKEGDFIANMDKFQISVRNPKVSSQNFGILTAGMKLVKLTELKPDSNFKDSWCTMGVVVEKGISKKSANGNEYLIWRVHDLKDCQTPTLKLLMFGNAIEEHWKMPIGSVIALLSPQVSADSTAAPSKKPAIVLRVAKGRQILEIGSSAHFGTCKGTRQDNNKCSNFVNTSLSEFCVYHVMSAARKISANRGTFNAVTCGPNLGGIAMIKKKTDLRRIKGNPVPPTANAPTIRPSACNSFSTLNAKKVTKQEEKANLEDILAQRKNTLAARQFLKMKENEKSVDKKGKLEEILGELGTNRRKEEKQMSMGDFLKNEERKERENVVDLSQTSSPGASRLWASSMNQAKKPTGARDAQEYAARLRAIAILKKQKSEGAVKRKAEPPNNEQEAKKAKTEKEERSKMDEIKKMLARKSIHHNEAEKEENDRLQKHLSSMEEREKIETFTTTCMSVKNIKVVTCNQCKYTAPTASKLCIEYGHKLVKHEAEKRFFKCSGCKHRTTCFEFMPTKPCNTCNENNWIRVAMRDERKVLLETENLEIRGEERTFVNS
ncbi:unnamed protein product [Caenorhabditis bovis]|uniref:Protein MCM10 homolog n=1 Tax=Caenorhabditis bovis TaxID=2654633 RepID=A0A8S1ERT8_9PELO|nr:unnamed protein product [Caenorhabditis bovis]